MLADYTTAPISPQLKATLGLVRKLVAERAVTPADMRAVLDAGVSRAAIEDAMYVAFCFNVITRLADAFEFWVGPPATFATSAKMLLQRGYNL